MNKIQIRRTVLTAVFTALISAGAFAILPIGPVPIVLTTLFVVLSGLLGGFRIGIYSVVVYLILGILGLPVFAGGAGGFAVIAGPTGGYLMGYLLAAAFAGLIFRSWNEKSRTANIILASLAALLAAASIYLPGLFWLKISLGLDWGKALSIGLLPFIPGDLLKTVVVVILTISLKERFSSFLQDK
ncbi:MAG: biotin transporter BioY [Spirochaetia bacterium]|nr:biotin transporter BioY [Spirochaetia bacterium]